MKKYKNSRQYGYRVINWRVLVLSSALLWCAVMGSYSGEDRVYVREQDPVMTPIVVEVEKPVKKVVVKTDKATIEAKIRHYFPRNADTMVAIAKAESHLSMEAKGYNCFYNSNKTKVYRERVKGSYSDACLPQDRVYAWSVDCFVLQKNYIGTECPKGVTLDAHLKEVAALSRVQGLEAWHAFNNGSYEVHLANK